MTALRPPSRSTYAGGVIALGGVAIGGAFATAGNAPWLRDYRYWLLTLFVVLAELSTIQIRRDSEVTEEITTSTSFSFAILLLFGPVAAMLALAGASDVVSAVFRNTILQLSVPDALRGRLSAVNIAVVTSGPRLGDVEAGAVASLTSTRFSVVSGGVACVLGALLLARLVPELAAHDSTADAEPERVEGLDRGG